MLTLELGLTENHYYYKTLQLLNTTADSKFNNDHCHSCQPCIRTCILVCKKMKSLCV